MHNIHFFAIGGMGGSGTRLLAELFQLAGVNMGKHLNISFDNLVFTVLFKNPKWREEASFKKITDRFKILVKTLEGSRLSVLEFFDLYRRVQLHPFPPDITPEFKQSIYYYLRNNPSSTSYLGWKEPNTYFYLEELFSLFKEITYYHVVRNGIDMAFSRNTNQLRNWGSYFGISTANKHETLENKQLRFWIHSTNYIYNLKQKYDKKIMLISYDKLCEDPLRMINNIWQKSVLPEIAIKDVEDVVKNWHRPSRTVNLKKLETSTILQAEELYNKIFKFGAD